MESGKIRVGIIGNPLHSWLSRSHYPALRALPEFEIVAVCTSRIESAREAAQKLGIPHACSSPGELARRPDVDLVVVGIRVNGHYDPVMASLTARKHVYCEWPLGVNHDQAAEMAQAAARSGVKAMVGLQSRAAPVLNRLKDLVAEGYVGRVLSCTLLSSNPNLGARVARNKTWLSDIAEGQHPLTIGGGHCLDAIRYVLGDDYGELSATVATQIPEQTIIETGERIAKDTPDQVAVNGTMKGGAIVSAHVQYGTYAATGLRLEVNGTDGDLIAFASERSGIQMARLGLKGARRSEEQEPVRLSIPDIYRSIPAAISDGEPQNVAQMYANLARSIRNDRTPSPDFEAALSLHRVIEAVDKASATGLRQAF